MAETAKRTPLIYCASDKELFDAFMSAPTHFNVPTLLAEGKKRGIFYSPQDSEESIAMSLSAQVFGYDDLREIEHYFEQIGRADKTASVRLDVVLTQDEIKAIAQEFHDQATEDEIYSSHPVGQSGFRIEMAYSDLDFGKNRFRQRTEKLAKVDIETGDGYTRITMPANSRGRGLVSALRDRVEEKRKNKIAANEVSLVDVTSAERRTEFFTSLIYGLPKSSLDDVLRIKVTSKRSSPADPEALDDSEIAIVEQTIAAALHGAALNGTSLLGTSIFQELKETGFYITSITWRVRLIEPQSPIVEFSAEFEDTQHCTGFRYSANAWKLKKSTGEYNKSAGPIPEMRRNELLAALETAAFSVLDDLHSKAAEAEGLSEGEA